MPQPPDWKRVLETGMHFTEMRRSQARRRVSELVAQGQLARDQIGAAVDELVEVSRRSAEELRAVVGAEVQRQLGVLGLATKSDLEALERRLRASFAAGAETKRAAAKPTGKSDGKASASKRASTKKTARQPAAKGAAKKAATKPAAKRAR